MRGVNSAPTTPKHSNITNLSTSYILSEEERRVLEKGLTFIPTPRGLDNRELKRDLYVYHRRLRLLDFFKYNTDFPHTPFTEPSTWIPDLEMASESIQKLIKSDLDSLSTLRPKKILKWNLTEGEKKALKTLSSNESLIIKPADKGSQIVLMDKIQYVSEANRQLSNVKHYAPLSHSIQLETQSMMREIVTELYQMDYICGKQLKYLMGPDTPKARHLYLLPKIHKPPDSWTVPHRIPPGRPIVSDCGSESSRIAEYIDYYINPLSQKHASYIKDTYDFVTKLKKVQVPNSAFLFSIDINSLYTNIDTQLGLQAVREAFQKYPDSSRPDAAILQLLELSLLRNDFEFNGKFYLQIHGTAMGKKFAPAFANLYMCMWEETAFPKSKTKPLFYLRYLDDLFGIWGDSREDFLEFVNILNSHHPAISVTYNLQTEALEFLDTQVYFIPREGESKRVGTRVWFKETDRHALLYKTSFHPKHTFAGLVKSQLIRFYRICTDPSDVEKATRVLFQALRPRGYSRRSLRTIKAEVKGVFQREGHYQKEPNARTLIPFVAKFSETVLRFNSQIKTHFEQAKSENAALETFRVISAYKRNKNLKDILVHSKMKKPSTSPLETRVTYPKFLTNTLSGTGGPVWQKLGLTNTNIIYAILCASCPLIYIGETQNTLGERLKQHLYLIKRGNRETPLYAHFQTHPIENVQIVGLESNLNWSKPQRQAAERRWIKNLNTIDPLGLNQKY